MWPSAYVLGRIAGDGAQQQDYYDAASAIDVPAIYVFVQEGLMLVKRLQRLPGGRVRVSSENGAYESYELDAAVLERPDSFIVGRVVWAGVRI